MNSLCSNVSLKISNTIAVRRRAFWSFHFDAQP